MSNPPVDYIPRFFVSHEPLFTLLCEQVEWDQRIRTRKTASFGLPYNYSGLTYRHVPMPDWSPAIVDSIEQHCGMRANNCLANLYPDGSSKMGYHADATDQLEPGTGIAVLSLGSLRKLHFRLTEDRMVTSELLLAAGSLLYMPSEMQVDWQHGLPADSDAGPRISLTFRQLVAPT